MFCSNWNCSCCSVGTSWLRWTIPGMQDSRLVLCDCVFRISNRPQMRPPFATAYSTATFNHLRAQGSRKRFGCAFCGVDLFFPCWFCFSSLFVLFEYPAGVDHKTVSKPCARTICTTGSDWKEALPWACAIFGLRPIPYL